MPKQKTTKSAGKRFSVSAGGAIEHRTARQSHFNARDTGDTTRKKHTDKKVSPSDKNRIRRLLPTLTS